jgi:hypothetical protein
MSGRGSFEGGWQETESAGTHSTSSRTQLLVCARARDGRAFIEITSFYQRREETSGAWHVGQRIVLPASEVKAVKGLLDQAAGLGAAFASVRNHVEVRQEPEGTEPAVPGREH